MQQHGFIHDMLDVKVLILFVASKALSAELAEDL